MELKIAFDTSEFNSNPEEKNVITEFTISENCLSIKTLDITRTVLYETEIEMSDAIVLSNIILEIGRLTNNG